MKLDALEHPKTMDLAARLEVNLPTAIGHLELLWAFTGKYAPSGDIGRHADGAIARACHWVGRPELFTLALREAGFLDADPTHRFTIHDWRDHAPRWVKSKLKTLGLTFVSGDCGDGSRDEDDDTGTDVSPDTGGDSKGSEVKSSEGKGKEVTLRARGVPGLNLEAFDRWVAYRQQIRKPLRQMSLEAAATSLAMFHMEQSAVVEQSISNGWQGLFPLKVKASTKAQQQQDANITAAQAFLNRDRGAA